MNLGPLASHPISACCASLDSMKPTPSVCGALSSSCPEYSISSPVASLLWPACVHLVSLSPNMESLKFFISLATWAVFPVSNIVLMFQLPILIVFLVVKRDVGAAASLRLSLQNVINPSSKRSLSTPRLCALVFVVNAFVTYDFFTG